MKQFSHAWLAFKAIERLEKADLGNNRQTADELIRWFWDHRDGVIRGAWYPDMVIKDMATSHVFKLTPQAGAPGRFGNMPSTSAVKEFALQSPVMGQSYTLDPKTNLPDRCEALAHSIIDNLKMVETEDKGSPITPSSNHTATRLFMLSHYIADAHMPFHCDSRKFSNGVDLHGKIEGLWDDEVRNCYEIDFLNERFYYNRDGYPLLFGTDFDNSFLKQVEAGFATRPFTDSYGSGTNVRTYMLTVCLNSYLLSYAFIPPGYDETNVTVQNLPSLPGQVLDFEQLSVAVFMDAIDAIARVWLRVWRRYLDWKN
jgi:hypothetical protein